MTPPAFLSINIVPRIVAAFPVGDWQFWVASALAGAAAAWLAWKLVPLALLRNWKRKPASKRTTLTIEGEKPATRRARK